VGVRLELKFSESKASRVIIYRRIATSFGVLSQISSHSSKSDYDDSSHHSSPRCRDGGGVSRVRAARVLAPRTEQRRVVARTGDDVLFA
jgi:hypothetical protein